MKKKQFFLPLLAALILSGCSNDEPVVSPYNGGTEGEPQYLTVNLMTASASGTLKSRAAGGQHSGEPNADTDDAAIYEEGLAGENTVNKIRFYFFDENGAAANVKKVGENWQNWLDWTNISEEENKMLNVEKILSAMLVINTKQEDKQPDKIVAIINPKEETGSKYSLGSDTPDLYTVTGDYQKFVSNNFVMSNSTYKKDNTKVVAVSVAGKIFGTSGEALQDPVDIYVERTVAKVRLNSDLLGTETDNGIIYKTFTDDKTQTITVTTGEGENATTTEKDIYVKFLGWNTTAVADKSRLIKEINPNWTDAETSLGFLWNWSDYCRSFWAINPTDLNYQYGAFRDNSNDNKNLFQAQAKTKFDRTEWVYVNENASNDETGTNPTTPTKVIIAAQLVDEKGAPLEFAEYGSQRCSIDDLKKLFANSCGLYKKTSSNPETYEKIAPSDLKIMTATEVGMANETQNGRYKVYIQLNDNATQKEWYPNNTPGQTNPLSPTEANKALKDLGSAKVWKNGYTYYYFDINHLGNKLGVVRNHIYDANITTLVGLGTPVYNPDEIIYPEKPNPDTYTYIAARINILSWRVVNSSVKLEW